MLGIGLGLTDQYGGNWWSDFISASGKRPALVLDYVDGPIGRYMADQAEKTFADLHTFTRASTATYRDNTGTIVTAASGAQRLDHDKDGNRLGLLVEEARTNLVLQSEAIDISPWGNVGTPVVTANAAAAPDGTTTADTVEDADAVSYEGRSQTISGIVTATKYTASVFVKKDTDETVFGGIQWNQSGGPSREVQINTKTGVVAKSSGQTSQTIGSEDYGDYWRFWITETSSGTGNLSIKLFPALATTLGGGLDASGQKASNYWGVQCELGAFPTSYIPTTTASVTRAAETANFAISEFPYDHSEGTWLVHIRQDQAINQMRLLAGVGAENIVSVSNTTTLTSWSGGASLNYPASDGTLVDGNLHKAAMGYDGAGRVVNIDGNAENTDATSPYMATTPTILSIGARSNNTNYAHSHFAAIVWYPSRLSNADLVALTA